MSAPPLVATELIAPRAIAFHQAQPGVVLAVLGAPGQAALDRGEAEIAVRMARPGQAGLVARRIGVMRYGLYAAPALAALPPERWTFIGYDESLEHLTQQVWLRRLLAGRPIVFQARDLICQREAARAGLGAMTLPRPIGDRDAALVRLPVIVPPPTRDLWLATYPDLRRSPAIRAAMDFLAELIGSICPTRDPEAAPAGGVGSGAP